MLNTPLGISSNRRSSKTGRSLAAFTARGFMPCLLSLILVVLVTGAASPAQGAEKFCSQYGGVLDGDVLGIPPTQITIDTDCTFQNWPSSNPLTTTVNFHTNDPSIYLIIFNNVEFIGNMACANVDHRIWFANGSDYGSNNTCQDLFIPVETINKQNPAGQTIASIGVPFTYTLTLPSMQFSGDPSINDLHSILITDDLTATGADLTYVSHNAQLKGSGTPVTLGFTNPDNKHLTFTYDQLPAGEQIVLEITVVLDNTAANVPGTQFVNTAKWFFGRLIEGQFYEPLPGEWGITQPMTIAGPSLVLTKTSNNTALGLGDTATFTINVQNNGDSDAWNATIVDQIPDGPDGGMCDFNPVTAPGGVTARIYAADGVTPLSGPLVKGVDYTVSYTGATTCRLDLTMLDTVKIGPSERLIITYQSQIDGDSKNTISLTNVAGVIQWFSGNSGFGGRREYNKGPLTNGTPGVLDFEDSETVLTVLTGYYFQKTVSNVTSGADPATKAAPGDRLHYRVRLFNVDQSINNITIADRLDPDSFDLSTFTMTTPPPAGAAYSFDSFTGLLTITGTASPLNVAAGDELIVEFEITLKDTLTNGTVVDNQATLSATGLTAPSDDPGVNGIAQPGGPADPTRVVIEAPLVTQKIVSIAVDNNANGLADPGDVLLYTITVSNNGASPVNGVTLVDEVPVDTTYVADSTTLNGLPAGRPDGGISPLISGIPVNSPGSAGGTIAPGSNALVTFKVTINAGVPVGTLISNQGFVSSGGLPTEPTDADGNPTNGNQPTIIVDGSAQQVIITKEVLVVGGGAALPGNELEYTVRVMNIGAFPTTSLVITDNLTALAGQATYVAGSATLEGTTAGVNFADPVVVANYGATYGDLPPGATATLRFRVLIAEGLETGTRLTNTAKMAWNTPTLTSTASVSIDVGGVIGNAMLSGQVWRDANLNKVCDDDETDLAGWTVGVYRGGVEVASATTDSTGLYSVSGLEPTQTVAGRYELRFTAPGAGANTASLGWGDSTFSNGPQRISDIIAPSGASLRNLNLPLTPNGSVYDSVQRTPVGGAALVMMNGTTNEPLPAVCFDDPAQQNQVTAADGSYKFDLNFSNPACTPGGTYLIGVTPPTGSNYAAAPSLIIPPNGTQAAPFSALACPGGVDDAMPSTDAYCEVTASASAPPASIPPRTSGTTYHLYFTLGNGTGQNQLFNNHIPVDPTLDGAVAITKTSSLINVTKGQLVPYTITVRNVLGAPLFDLIILDRFPAGFKYVEGSARLDGVPVEPGLSGLDLQWDNVELQFDVVRTLKLLLVVGAGVTEGEYVNRAQVLNSASGGSVSGEATATVRVVPDPTFDCTDVIGKVFDDGNLNGKQDPGEKGLSGVRLVTARGLISTSDQYGRFHIACAAVPDEDRGSNFILKLDERSLPTGYRMTTENPRVERATRGDMIRFNFGATIHRVVRIDLADGVFEPDTTVMRMQWSHKIDELLEELKKGPSVLRLSYLADVEKSGIVRERLAALKKEISGKWKQSGGNYRLDIETETFWRR